MDDGSTDNTQNVVEGIDDKRIRYIKHETNRGACAARNTGISFAKGTHIAFQDSDDEWLLDKLEKQIITLEKCGADLVFCKYIRQDSKEKSVIGSSGYTEGFLDPVVNLYGIGTQTILAKATVFANNYFDIDMPGFQDLELLVCISNRYSIYCMDEALVQYNLQSDSISMKNPKKLFYTCCLLLDKHSSIVADYPKMCKRIAYRLLVESVSIKNDWNSLIKIYKVAYIYEPDIKCILKIFKSITVDRYMRR